MKPDYDLVIIGGGINGAGIARDAAGRGLKVLLVEAQDLAGATSSASTKLIHGGLRYLEYYEFHLVSEALKEREVLLGIAPHLVSPLEFVLPHDLLQRARDVEATVQRKHAARVGGEPADHAVPVRHGERALRVSG